MGKKTVIGLGLVLFLLFLAGCSQQAETEKNEAEEKEKGGEENLEKSETGQPGLFISNCKYDSQQKVIRVAIENRGNETTEKFTLTGKSVDENTFSITTTEPLSPGNSLEISSALEVVPEFVEVSSPKYPKISNKADCS